MQSGQGLYAPKARRGIVQGPTKTTAEEDEFDLSQHDGRNLAFQMKNSNVQPSPCPNGVAPRGLMRNLSTESFGSLSRMVEQELANSADQVQGNTSMAGRGGCDLESVAMTHEDFGPVLLNQSGLDNIVGVLYAGKTKKGFAPNNPTKRNQDSFIMQNDIATSSLVIACFDGHGQFGHDVSKFCKVFMETTLVSHPLFLKDLHRAILDVTAQLEKEMMAAAHVDTVFSGTTMVLLIMQGTIVTVANVGDSRVILGYQKDISPPGTAPRPKVRVIPPPDSPGTSHEEISVQAAKGVKPSSAPEYYTAGVDVDDVEVDTREWGIITTMPLSTDHKPDDPREAAVIIAAGGRVKDVHGTHRVYLALDDVPGLAMSRSLGDYVAHSAGVSAVPEVFQYDLTALYADDITAETKTKDSKAVGTALNGEVHRDMVLLETGEVAVRCCILVATDGLFDMMSNDAAVDIAFNHWSDPAAAAEEMIVKTGNDWMATWGLADDTTVCVVNLEHAGCPHVRG